MSKSAPPDHIPAHGGFGDVDAEHQQLAVDPRGAPQRVLAVHTSDQRAELGSNPWPTAEVAGLPASVGAEPATVPADHRFRLDDEDRVEESRI